MKFLIIVLLSLATHKCALAQEDVEPSEPLQDTTNNQDYLIQLLLNISEARIPNYLVGVIYTRPEEKGISTQAVMNLYQTGSISLASARNILQQLNIPENQVFSINGFYYTYNTFNWTFTNFYNTIIARLNLGGTSLRTALETLEIDVGQFSSGITWGDPDPWQEFIKGNITEANLELACTQAGTTLENLWVATRDIFISDLNTFLVHDFVEFLLNHNINQPQALTIWNAVPVTVQNVYNIQLFNSILTNFSARINSQTALGVVTGSQEIVIHRSIHDNFGEERDLLDIQAQTLVSRLTLDITTIDSTKYRNLVVLRHSEAEANTFLTVIPIANQNANLTNCSYVTFQNNNVLVSLVPSAIFIDETYQIPGSVSQNVISGSALVCNNTVYGLARGVENNLIIADAFSDYVAPVTPEPNSACIFSFSFLILVLLMTIQNLI